MLKGLFRGKRNKSRGGKRFGAGDFSDNERSRQNARERQREKAKQALINAKKREIQSLMNKANKRLKRLEKSDLKSSPAYQGLYRQGGWTKEESRFGVRGKTAKEINAEYIRIRRFLDDKTSTVRGALNVLADTAKNVGLSYNSKRDLIKIAPKFFELASKAEQYLKTSGRLAEALDYNRIHKVINNLVKAGEIDLKNVEDVTTKVNTLIEEINNLNNY